MLTLFLLVVLGGGGALLAVWFVDPNGVSRLKGRLDPGSLRAARHAATARTRRRRPGGAPEAAGAPEPSSVLAAAADLLRTPPEPPATYEPLEVQEAPPATAPRQRRRGDVPPAFTAVEGSWREVGVVPTWRRATSALLLVLLLAGAGIGLAAVTAGALGAAAELVDGAVG